MPESLPQKPPKSLKKGIVVAIARGELMLNIPYLRESVLKDAPQNPEPILAQEWGF